MSDPEFRGKYNRGYLPHFDFPEASQFITYRLADSLPAHVVERMKAETTQPGDTLAPNVARCRDAGHGACWLQRPDVADVVVENLRYHDGTKYTLKDWVVMPNHMHVSYGNPRDTMSRILQSWKSYTSNVIRNMVPIDDDMPLWQPGYFDRYIRDKRHFFNVRCYIILNPVVAGLVDDPFDWPYSSVHNYQPAMKSSLRRWYRQWRDRFWHGSVPPEEED